MSWKPEVIADSTGQWVGNALRFATKEEAEANVKNLAGRWPLDAGARHPRGRERRAVPIPMESL